MTVVLKAGQPIENRKMRLGDTLVRSFERYEDRPMTYHVFSNEYFFCVSFFCSDLRCVQFGHAVMLRFNR